MPQESKSSFKYLFVLIFLFSVSFSQDDCNDSLALNYNADSNDLTDEVLKNLEYLGVEFLIPIGGDDTLSYGFSNFN